MLPGVYIKLENDALGRVSASSDGVAGMILSGKAVSGKFTLNAVYQFSSTRDLTTHGVTEENNELIYKDVLSFYEQAGDGAELYLIAVTDAMLLQEMCSMEEGSALRKLIDYGKGRIRLVGVNRAPTKEYTSDTQAGIDKDVITAMMGAQLTAENYASKISPFRLLLPALDWSGSMEDLFKPREGSCNRVGIVMAADKEINGRASAAIGRVLGRAASLAVNQSIARVKSGALAPDGMQTDGRPVEATAGLADGLNDAGYIFYRSYVGKNGYYLNDDCLAAPLSDDYSNLNLGRVIDKAIVLAYTAYIDEVQDSIEVDDKGQIPSYLCTYYESVIENAVGIAMAGEISRFEAYVDPSQNVLSSSRLDVSCKIVPKGITRSINVTLGFDNPSLKQ